MDGISVRELQKQPPFDQVSVVTMERWCNEDEWVRRRQQYFERIRADIESRIAEKMVQTRIEQLKQIDRQVEQVFTEVDGVKAKSKEGLLTALVRLLEAGDGIREKLSKEVVPAHLGGVPQETIPLTPTLSEEEAREAARAVLQRRRMATRSRARARQQEEAEAEPKKKPRLRVVQGDSDGGME